MVQQKKKNSFKAVRAKKWYDTQRIITRYWPNSWKKKKVSRKWKGIFKLLKEKKNLYQVSHTSEDKLKTYEINKVQNSSQVLCVVRSARENLLVWRKMIQDNLLYFQNQRWWEIANTKHCHFLLLVSKMAYI